MCAGIVLRGEKAAAGSIDAAGHRLKLWLQTLLAG
jgi:hypothetical protein